MQAATMKAATPTAQQSWTEVVAWTCSYRFRYSLSTTQFLRDVLELAPAYIIPCRAMLSSVPHFSPVRQGSVSEVLLNAILELQKQEQQEKRLYLTRPDTVIEQCYDFYYEYLQSKYAVAGICGIRVSDSQVRIQCRKYSVELQDAISTDLAGHNIPQNCQVCAVRA